MADPGLGGLAKKRGGGLAEGSGALRHNNTSDSPFGLFSVDVMWDASHRPRAYSRHLRIGTPKPKQPQACWRQ